jgi:hypothetical protein
MLPAVLYRLLLSKCVAEIWKERPNAPKVSVIVHGLLQAWHVMNSVMLQPFLSKFMLICPCIVNQFLKMFQQDNTFLCSILFPVNGYTCFR